MTHLRVQYEHFVQKVASAKKAWVLKNSDGYLQVSSERFAEVDVIPFFSSQKQATAVAASLGEGYVAEALPLEECLEDWWPAMEADNVWLGVDFDEMLEGLEIEAWQVLEDVLRCIEKQGIDQHQ